MKITINGFITLRNPKATWGQKYTFLQSDITGSEYADGRVMVRPHAFEVDIADDYDPRPQQVAALVADRVKALAEFGARVTEIDRKIAELQCLELTPIFENEEGLVYER